MFGKILLGAWIFSSVYAYLTCLITVNTEANKVRNRLKQKVSDEVRSAYRKSL